MARGWESKSVEAQIDAAVAKRSSAIRKQESKEQLEQVRERESLVLSRTRISRELENVTSSRYRAVLEKALADLNTKIDAIK